MGGVKQVLYDRFLTLTIAISFVSICMAQERGFSQATKKETSIDSVVIHEIGHSLEFKEFISAKLDHQYSSYLSIMTFSRVDRDYGVILKKGRLNLPSELMDRVITSKEMLSSKLPIENKPFANYILPDTAVYTTLLLDGTVVMVDSSGFYRVFTPPLYVHSYTHRSAKRDALLKKYPEYEMVDNTEKLRIEKQVIQNNPELLTKLKRFPNTAIYAYENRMTYSVP